MRVVIGVLVWGRVRIKIRIRVRVGVMLMLVFLMGAIVAGADALHSLMGAKK